MKRPACVAVALVALLASRAAGEPLRTRSDAVCRNAAGTELALPAGWYIYPPEDRDAVDSALRTAEDRVTALAAENARLRAGEGRDPGSPWAALALVSVAVAAGVGLGWYVRGSD